MTKNHLAGLLPAPAPVDFSYVAPRVEIVVPNTHTNPAPNVVPWGVWIGQVN